MVPLRFETRSGQDLFAVHHEPASPGNGIAVLVLAPFGQEAIRAHRLLRVLADRLVRHGCHVLRFDYRGSGDSDGDDLEADLGRWREDALAAHRELARRSGCPDIRWLGLRVGFAVGYQAVTAWPAGDRPPPTRLVGWDPVLDGPAYLDELAAGHAAALRRAYSLPTVAEAELARLADEPEPTEALGFALSPAMVRDLRAIAIGSGTVPPARTSLAAIRSRAVRSRAVLPEGSHGRAAGQRAAPAGLSIEDVDVDFDWVSEEALNTPLVPDVALRRLITLLGVGSA